MHGKKWVLVPAFLAVLLNMTGCAHVISSEMREMAKSRPSFSAALANPEAYKGQTVIWGGIILDTINREDATLIVVLETPLDYEGMPTERWRSEGRFLAKVGRYVDKEVYRPDYPITVAGEIEGKEVLPVGDAQYTYPVVLLKEDHLWTPPRPPYYYGPPGYPFGFWYGYSPGYWYGYPPWFWQGYPYPWW